MKISNATLLASEHAVSSSDEEDTMDNDKKRKMRRIKWKDKQRQQTEARAVELKSGLQHQVDYFLVGPNAWTLLSSKFGYDYSLPRPCIPVQTTESRMGVQVYPDQVGTYVPVPASGHFSYGASPPVVADDTDISETAQADDDLVRFIVGYIAASAPSHSNALTFSNAPPHIFSFPTMLMKMSVTTTKWEERFTVISTRIQFSCCLHPLRIKTMTWSLKARHLAHFKRENATRVVSEI